VRRPLMPGLESEPDVRGALDDGADLVAFSCDKLLGGPQAGVIAGRSDLVRALARAPIMRALRIGKLTIAALASACRGYLDESKLAVNNPLFSFLRRPIGERKRLAEKLLGELASRGIQARVVASFGQAGGGTLPELKMESFAVALVGPSKNVQQREAFAEGVFHALLRAGRPVLGVLREGAVLFDVFALTEEEIVPLAAQAAECVTRLPGAEGGDGR
jgi:L-seryl-tRNA(Ser) seleniumtransferase